MFGAMLNLILIFVFLYGLIWLFERKHREIDAFQVAVPVLVPVIASFLVGLGAAFLNLGAVGVWTSVVVLIGATYLSLWKIMGLPGKRSAGYTAAVFVFSIGVRVALDSLLA